MGDLFVHVRMKDCCRKALGELDAIKKGLPGTGAFKVPLLKALGDKTVPDAMTALSTTIGKSAPEGDRRLTSIKKKSLSKAAAAHAKVHQAKAETTEASFWEVLASVFEGKDAATILAASGGAAGLLGAAAGGKAGTSVPGGLGGKIAEKAKEKVAEYKKAGITYAQTGAAGTADCSHFVHDVLKSSGVSVPYVTTKDIATSSHFQKVTDPQPGDVIWQPGHMGIYTGTNEKGQPLGAQMGEHGAATGTWGEGGWFKGGNQVTYYRPQTGGG